MTHVFTFLIQPNTINSKDLGFLESFLTKSQLKHIQKKQKQDQINSTMALLTVKMLAHLLFHIPMTSTQISYTSKGKPHFSHNIKVCFSLTHSDQFIAIAIAKTTNKFRIGIDLEIPYANYPLESNIENIFPYNQRTYLKGLYGAQKISEFYKLWVCNESLMKMVGIGLLNGLSYIDFNPFTNPPQLIKPKKLSLNSSIFFKYETRNNSYLAVCTSQNSYYRYDDSLTTADILHFYQSIQL